MQNTALVWNLYGAGLFNYQTHIVRYQIVNQDSLDGMEKNGRKNSVKSDLGSKRRTQRIGEQLRRVYDEVAQEDVPDEFLRLLEEADRARPSSTSDKSRGGFHDRQYGKTQRS